MTKPTPASLKKMIADNIAFNKSVIESCKGETNPQLIAMRNQAQGSIDAYEAVLEAMNGQCFLIKIHTTR